MTSRQTLRIALAKPDYHITGGFERLIDGVVEFLRGDGHIVEFLTVDVAQLPRQAYGVTIPDAVWERNAEFFRYAALMDAFAHVNASRYDLVISTQPPSFAVPHRRHLSLFSHHHKVFYDLSDVYVAAGFVDAELHSAAQTRARRLDDAAMRNPGLFLATSDTVRRRLHDFNNVDNVGVFLVGPVVAPPDSAAINPEPGGDVLCVSRHEFSKRAELFVHAMKHVSHLRGVAAGTGGRLEWAHAVDARLSQPGIDLDGVADADTWLNRGVVDGPYPVSSGQSNVSLPGYVPDARLRELYASALCVVAPAYEEDYGLTALEAMAYARPLIVCRDGGGLTGFVDDGVNGFVVEPTSRAIAAAIRQLDDDRDLARRMGAASRERALDYTWERGLTQMQAGLDTVMS